MDEHGFNSIKRRLEEAKPRANAMDGWILAIVVFCLFSGRTIYCASVGGDFQACMQSGMPRGIGMSLQAGVLILAVWAGPKIGRRFESQVLGYVSGGMILLALSALLLWLGIVPP